MIDKKILFKRPIIVYCSSFDKEVGGIVVLHYLVDQLRSLNVDAYAVQIKKEYPNNLPRLIKKIKNWNFNRNNEFTTHPSMDVPVLKSKISKEAIIIYPEIIDGNPLGAKHVVRWLLHKQSFLGGAGNFGSDDAIFYYSEFCRNNDPNVPVDNKLHITPIIQTDYYDFTDSPRYGSCRMLRKGSLDNNTDLNYGGTAILLDGKSHSEIAEVFRKTKYFYCHDVHTWFHYLAALSGCIPIVVPQNGLSAEDWRKDGGFKYGVAYGLEEIEWATKTRNKLLDDVQSDQACDQKNLIKFLDKLNLIFG